ncbi:hypothetical protein MBUL_03283 [Methylobacterium bullatum]|uniref:Uncharacterized protein n=1 Tax=Methylobacterium bullatum TaxID=570505 RepID=A0A679JA90_9HYPH|nr:hypothetical protein MBUL_03283 [Methylobacterium bullatum]
MGTLDAPVLANLHGGRVDPEVGPLALDRPIEERAHALVDLLVQPRHLAFRHAGATHRLYQIVHRAGQDALDVPPGSPRSAPSRPAGVALESPGNTSPCATSGCATPPCQPGPANPGRDSLCAGPAARRSSRRGRPRSGRPPPVPSAARPQSRSSRAADPRRRSSPSAREGSSSRRSSGDSRVRGWSSQPDPTRQPPMTTRQLHHRLRHDPISPPPTLEKTMSICA